MREQSSGQGSGCSSCLSGTCQQARAQLGSTAVFGGFTQSKAIWWFKDKQDRIQVLNSWPANSSQNHGRSWCHTNHCWGWLRGDPHSRLCSQGSDMALCLHQRFSFQGLIQCVSHSWADLHVTEIKHLMNTDERVTVYKCTAGGSGLYFGECIGETLTCTSRMPEGDPPS